MGNTAGELLAAASAATIVIVFVAAAAAAAAVIVVLIVDVVEQGPDSQAPRIGRAALLSAPLRELRAGRRILGDSRTDDGIYYGLHVFQRYQSVASVSRSVPFEGELSRDTPGTEKPPLPPPLAPGGCTMYGCM